MAKRRDPDLSKELDKNAGRVLLEACNLERRFGNDPYAFDVLKGITTQFAQGEIVAIYGESGSGKSTLLHLLSGLDRPTRGHVSFDGYRLDQMNDKELAALRASDFGYVLQQSNLIPSLSVLDNVQLPLLCAGFSRDESRERTLAVLDRVGIAHRKDALPDEVSGGESQRAAIARACAGNQRVVFADEPTGALDTRSSRSVLELFAEVARERETTLVVITHDPKTSRIADRVLTMRDGVLT